MNGKVEVEASPAGKKPEVLQWHGTGLTNATGATETAKQCGHVMFLLTTALLRAEILVPNTLVKQGLRVRTCFSCGSSVWSTYFSLPLMSPWALWLSSVTQ